MPRYSTYGELDTKPVIEVESGFKGYNNFFRPDQLPAGLLAQSLNGRIGISGEWQPRPGLNVTLAPFTAPDFILPFYAYGNENSSALSAIAGSTITITIVGHSFNDQTLANVSGITGVTPDPNGNRTITVVDVDNISITVSGISGTPAGTATVGAPKIETTPASIRGATPFYDDGNSNTAYIIIAGDSEATAYNMETGTTAAIAYPASLTLTSDVEMLQFNNKVFIFIDGATALEWDGDLSGGLAFTRVANGAYAQPSEMTATGTPAFVISNGVATVTPDSFDSVAVGDEVVLVTAGTSGLTAGESFEVSSVNGTTDFSFYVDSPDVSNQTDTVWIKKVSQSLGYSHQPAFPWAEAHQSRLVGPYNYTMAGSSGASPTITDRGVRDEIIFSRKFNTDVYDHIYGQFKFNPGKSDYVVALHSFSDDQLVVLNRESVYVISNSQDVKQANVKLLTADLGCIARNSVVRVGDRVVFLSDNGVYALSFADLYNLRGQDVPLSKAINEDINRINWDHASKASAVYFDNRYYLAIPIDGNTTNNAVFVFNFLNNEWESLDTVDNSSWQYKKLMVAGDESLRGVYTIDASGGIHKLDASEDGQDRVITQAGGTTYTDAVLGKAITRSITGKTVERKRWKEWDLHVESHADYDSDCILTALLENLDSTIALGSLSDYNAGVTLSAGNSGSFRGRFGGRRSYGIQFQIENTSGRPKLRALQTTGQGSMSSTNSAT